MRWRRIAGAAAAATLLLTGIGRGAGSAPVSAAGSRAAGDPPAAAPLRVRRIHIVERRVRPLPGGRTEPRTLSTTVWVPPGTGPFPLVVFAHGFDITPKPYAALLEAWARSGFIVAAPTFPRTSPGAPGGLDESDILNQPGDLSAVITWLLGRSRQAGTPWSGLLEPGAVAVAGQSDGGITALLSGFNRHYRDRRVRADVVLSGAELQSLRGWSFGRGAPALFAAQGTADTTNEPRYTMQFYAQARAPKFLLRLIGAGHLPPYTSEQPQLSVVEATTTAFLERYLMDRPDALARMRRAAKDAHIARLTLDP
ncbi:MAG TPA: CocE/NonD family hydrolase [Solirubrobacteraceae bacterium]|nr:CocE/NonD family hydrolase [Solirubrobacteraceae bacterium]